MATIAGFVGRSEDVVENRALRKRRNRVAVAHYPDFVESRTVRCCFRTSLWGFGIGRAYCHISVAPRGTVDAVLLSALEARRKLSG
jgi:hypothetical protein